MDCHRGAVGEKEMFTILMEIRNLILMGLGIASHYKY